MLLVYKENLAPETERTLPYDREEAGEVEMDIRLDPQTNIDTKELIVDLQQELLGQITLKTRGYIYNAIGSVKGVSLAYREKLREYLLTKNMVDPLFTLATGSEAEKLLQTAYPSYDQGISPEEVVVIFSLPKPIEQWWRKGGETYKGAKLDLNNRGFVVPWGRIYEGVLRQCVWDLKEDFVFEYADSIEFERVNEINEHDKFNYYYIWKFARK